MYVTCAFRKLALKLGLTTIRFHDLRHTHASLLLKEGVHAKVVSERLGQVDVGITLNTITHFAGTRHLLPGLQEAGARARSKREAEPRGTKAGSGAVGGRRQVKNSNGWVLPSRCSPRGYPLHPSGGGCSP
jgi:hypothetical protein